MTVPELALHHQRLEARAVHLQTQIERLEAELSRNPEAERLEQAVGSSQTARREVDLGVLRREREAETRRARLKARERELMSGRINNPGELMRLSGEVEHLKSALAKEEEDEMVLLEEQERLDKEIAGLEADLEAARSRGEAAAPGLEEDLRRLRSGLAEAETEREASWRQLPPDWQKAYRRVGGRLANPVAEVVRGQCQACHVGVTSSGMQVLRRAGLLACDNCGRLLVVA
jgi:predicted  nucleic acid-binding Zn-ribbon protein